MSDPFKTTTNQERNILKEARERRKASSFASTEKEQSPKGKKKDKAPTRVSELYKTGITLLESKKFKVELTEGGHHCNHRILKPSRPPAVEGVKYPHEFNPMQDISEEDDFEVIESCFHPDLCSQEVRDFWLPLFRPKAGDSELLSFTERLLKMRKIKQTQSVHEPMDYGHTFDPAGRWGGEAVFHPRIWVPDRDWFHPALKEVTFSDVFTIFPEAEQEMLKLILGRVGVGRANHQPPGRKDPVDHTARMAGVIVGKDAGLGKSTLFNGLIAALQKCGFTSHTFKNTEDRFGMQAAALSDISYKDDTSLASLKKFLAAEETKILITGGLFQVEEKFQKAEQIWPKTVILLNANDWNSKFAYDLDPGIIDRIKLISTYREYEVAKNRENLHGMASFGSPDLRPRAHIPYLANKLGVSVDALYLWCLRLATDRFWDVITDNRDPSINRLQVEVRYWTTRQRIRFKADVTQALVNAMAFSWLIRTKESQIPELTPTILTECLDHFYFVGVDPSAQSLTEKMKESWSKAGRPTTHYYQGFREIRWESVKKACEQAMRITAKDTQNASVFTAAEMIKEIIERLVMRDGFKVGGAANYIIETWENMRHASEELQLEGDLLCDELEDRDLKRLNNVDTKCFDRWIDNKHYSPDRAEVFRKKARKDLYGLEG